MSYLTRKEYDVVVAVQSYTPRPLTDLEIVIKQLKETIELPSPTMKCRENKQHSLTQVLKNLEMVTEDKNRWEQVKDVIADNKRLDALLTSFPYVKFEKEINSSVKLNYFQLAHRDGLKEAELYATALWLRSFIELAKMLPTDKNCFINTPATTRADVRRFGKTNPATYAISLEGKSGQIVEELFGKDKDVLVNVLRYKLWGQLDELNRRLSLQLRELSTVFIRNDVDYLIFIDCVEDHLTGINYLEVILSPKVNPGGEIPSNTFKFIVDRDY